MIKAAQKGRTVLRQKIREWRVLIAMREEWEAVLVKKWTEEGIVRAGRSGESRNGIRNRVEGVVCSDSGDGGKGGHVEGKVKEALSGGRLEGVAWSGGGTDSAWQFAAPMQAR